MLYSREMALDEPLFCTESLWEAFQWCESGNVKKMDIESFSHVQNNVHGDHKTGDTKCKKVFCALYVVITHSLTNVITLTKNVTFSIVLKNFTCSSSWLTLLAVSPSKLLPGLRATILSIHAGVSSSVNLVF